MTPKRLTKCCIECHQPLHPGRAAKFCGVPCKATWNNRRKSRGQDLYDLFMNMRYNRAVASEAGVWAEMCRLAEGWHDEDLAANRQSYDPPSVVLPRLKDAGRLVRARPIQDMTGRSARR
jgi:hypothetical protein